MLCELDAGFGAVPDTGPGFDDSTTSLYACDCRAGSRGGAPEGAPGGALLLLSLLAVRTRKRRAAR